MTDATPASTPDTKKADQKFCFSCGNLLHVSATNCPKCGAVQPHQGGHVAPAFVPPPAASGGAAPATAMPANHVFCRGCGAHIHESAPACPKCGAEQRAHRPAAGATEKVTAALFALLLGGFGAHKFYLRRWVQGILYLLLCWTFIPAIIAFIEGIIYLTMSDAEFQRRYAVA